MTERSIFLRLMLVAIPLMAAEAARAEGLYWVVGNRATGRCEIVTSNPVIVGDIWFGDGPYRSNAEARLARSTINACPKTEPAAGSDPAKESDAEKE